MTKLFVEAYASEDMRGLLEQAAGFERQGQA
jgi:hypothetical protein